MFRLLKLVALTLSGLIVVVAVGTDAKKAEAYTYFTLYSEPFHSAAVNPVDHSLWFTSGAIGGSMRVERFERGDSGYQSYSTFTHLHPARQIAEFTFGQSGIMYSITYDDSGDYFLNSYSVNYAMRNLVPKWSKNLGKFHPGAIAIDSSSRLYLANSTGQVRIYVPTNSAATKFKLSKKFKVKYCYGEYSCVSAIAIQPGTRNLWVSSYAKTKVLIYNTKKKTIKKASSTLSLASPHFIPNTWPGKAIFVQSGHVFINWQVKGYDSQNYVTETLASTRGAVATPIFETWSNVNYGFNAPVGVGNEIVGFEYSGRAWLWNH